jgi:transposase-like protein
MREHEGNKAEAAEKGIKSNPAVRTRGRWSQEQKRQLVERWKAGGQSRVEFSRENKLFYGAFLRWTREAEASTEGAGRFVEVEIDALGAERQSTPMAESAFDLAELIAPTGWRIRLPQQFKPGLIKEVMKLLESC